MMKPFFLLTLIAGIVQTGFCRGDKVIPQVVNGPGWATKFDLTNISSVQPIQNMRLSFYKSDGSKWTVQTNRGIDSDFPLSLQARQTIRVETQGGGSELIAGYAVIYDEETLNSRYSEDFVLGISVFYVVSAAAGVVDTVTVSVPQPTGAANAPMQMDDSNGIYSGLAMVNWSGAANTVYVDLYSENGTQYGSTKQINLDPGKQWAGYLDNPDLFPGLKQFKGMAQITAMGPIALLGLLQTRARDGSPQYSTLVPVDREALRRNSYMVLLQASDDVNPFMPIDLDGFVADYFRIAEGTEYYSWDLEYVYSPPAGTSRYLQPEADNGAAIAPVGYRNDLDFDNISLHDLQHNFTYTTNAIDLSDGSTSLITGFTFAVRTDLGNFAKIRIVRIIDTEDGQHLNNRDLVLEVYIYK